MKPWLHVLPSPLGPIDLCATTDGVLVYLGFSLTEAKDIIDMYESPRDTGAQLQKFLDVLAQHRKQLEAQMADMQANMDELKTHEKEARVLLAKVLGKPGTRRVA